MYLRTYTCMHTCTCAYTHTHTHTLHTKFISTVGSRLYNSSSHKSNVLHHCHFYLKMQPWWNLYTSCLLACHVMLITGDSGLCCCVPCHRCYINRTLLAPFVVSCTFHCPFCHHWCHVCSSCHLPRGFLSWNWPGFSSKSSYCGNLPEKKQFYNTWK